MFPCCSLAQVHCPAFCCACRPPWHSFFAPDQRIRSSKSPLLAGSGPFPCRAPAFVRLRAEGRAPAAAQRHAAPCAWWACHTLLHPCTLLPASALSCKPPTLALACMRLHSSLGLPPTHPPTKPASSRSQPHLPACPSLPHASGCLPRLLLQRQVCERSQLAPDQLHGCGSHRDVRHQPQ